MDEAGAGGFAVDDPSYEAAVREEMLRLEASIQEELRLMSELKGGNDLTQSQEFAAVNRGVSNFEKTPLKTPWPSAGCRLFYKA
jgi:hypothetical protein